MISTVVGEQSDGQEPESIIVEEQGATAVIVLLLSPLDLTRLPVKKLLRRTFEAQTYSTLHMKY
jgi:hypothetical protein